MDEKKWKKASDFLLNDMEATASHMRELIVAMPPHDLLGFIYDQYLKKAIAEQSSTPTKHSCFIKRRTTFSERQTCCR
jgi:hypothetical protein